MGVVLVFVTDTIFASCGLGCVVTLGRVANFGSIFSIVFCWSELVMMLFPSLGLWCISRWGEGERCWLQNDCTEVVALCWVATVASVARSHQYHC